MCLVVPLKIKKKQGDEWLMEDGRKVKSLVGKVKVGEYLICKQDLGVAKLSKRESLLMRQSLKGVYDKIK